MFKNIIFSILKNKKQKTVFDCQTCFFGFVFVMDNKKLFSKTIVKQTLILLFDFNIKKIKKIKYN